MKTRMLWALALPTLAAMPMSAQAAKSDFSDCDGLTAPGVKGDGITREASGFGYGGIPSQYFASLGRDRRVETCTRALADPRLLPTQTVRRVSLLQARAIGQLEAGNVAAANTDLTEAGKIALPFVSEPLFVRSLGVSLTLSRAAAALAAGKPQVARDLAYRAAAARPYSARAQMAAIWVLRRTGETPSAAPANSPYRTLLRLDPGSIDSWFEAEFDSGNFAKAAALFAGAEARLGGRQPIEIVVRSGQGAYALATQGEGERARALIAAASARLASAFPQMPAETAGPRPVNPYRVQVQTYLDRTAKLVEARLAIAEGKPQIAVQALIGQDLPANAGSVELIESLRAALPEAQRGLAPDASGIRAKVAESDAAELRDLNGFESLLPEPENDKNLTEYKKSSRSILNSLTAGYVPDGFRTRALGMADGLTIEYIGKQSSVATVSELTLLHAANLAVQRGKPGLVVTGLREYRRTLTTTRGFSRTPISTSNAGFKSELDVRFVDPAKLPADLTGEGVRVINVADVRAKLGPIYAPSAD